MDITPEVYAKYTDYFAAQLDQLEHTAENQRSLVEPVDFYTWVNQFGGYPPS